MTRSMAAEWGQHKIRVVSIAPGYIEATEGFDRLGGFAMKDPAQYARENIPIGMTRAIHS